MDIDIIGVPLDFGSGRRGVDMGPSAIRYAGLHSALEALGHTVTDQGSLAVPLSETCLEGNPQLKYLEPITPVLQELMGRVARSVDEGRFPLILGGDHSLALGSVAGAARRRRLGVIWLDAHGDFNTDETTPSGNIHGMPLAALCGIGAREFVTLGGSKPAGPTLSPHQVAVVGLRSMDEQEKRLLREAGVAVFSMDMIDRFGIAEVMSRAISVVTRGTDGIYLSLDLDVLDPMLAPGVGTPVRGGLTYREAHLAVELLAETNLLIGMDAVEVNPILDTVNITAALAVELALSACGKRIWDPH
ncbi:MAG: arginase [Gemmatimonadetes bacterium]|nr:arginase [Gemmatimonadota bacterium]